MSLAKLRKHSEQFHRFSYSEVKNINLPLRERLSASDSHCEDGTEGDSISEEATFV